MTDFNQLPDFDEILQEIKNLAEPLPKADTLGNAYLLAELACICLDRLQLSHQAPADFWLCLDKDDANRLQRFLRSASHGVSQTANDLWHHTNNDLWNRTDQMRVEAAQ